ncbi:hypothetical protein N657DRAFT_640142 [Parathielavia appendiculata]|uniref:Uncharacterized protein n=1 Tax=Parathielavia appendiculata TaxID=2587402 RepID=A0AAN6UBB4_9PEZI|nr:hypothetical protein N657DRAFT_640142 [Parathielavia appendiculata]
MFACFDVILHQHRNDRALQTHSHQWRHRCCKCETPVSSVAFDQHHNLRTRVPQAFQL